MDFKIAKRHFFLLIALTISIGAIGTAPERGFAQAQRKPKYPPVSTIECRDCDEFWVISTENICPCGFFPKDLIVSKREKANWKNADINEVFKAHHTDELRTVIFVHGNRTNSRWAEHRGLEIYERMLAAKDCAPFRMIVWAWPSDDCEKPVKNYLPIVNRSMNEGYSLGWFLSVAGRSEKTSLFGYSLGVQAVMSGLEVATRCYGACDQYRVVTLAPVTACRWPKCRCPKGNKQLNLAYERIEKLYVVSSSRDFAVKWFKTGCRVATKRCTVGIDKLKKIDCEKKICEINVVDCVGRVHGVQEYLDSKQVASQMLNYLVLECECKSDCGCWSKTNVDSRIAPANDPDIRIDAADQTPAPQK
jgi:hypothetical protein